MASSSLEVNDPVHVSRDNRQLEGVVAYIGPVDFSAESDWIGIRLTGASVGLGKNDGTVQGKSYFSCPPACGIFVRQSSVSKRALTKLEELKLRRELAKSGSSVGGGSSTTTPPKATITAASSSSTRKSLSSSTPATTPTPAVRTTPTREKSPKTTVRKTPPRDSAAATTTPASAKGATDTQSKLEELRARREALKARKKEVGVTEETPAVSAPPLAASSETTELVQKTEQELQEAKSQLASVTSKLEANEQETMSLKEELNKAQETIQELKASNQELETKLATASVVASAPPPPTATTAVSSSVNDTEALQQELLIVQSKCDEYRDQAESALTEVTNLKRQLETEKSQNAEAADKLTNALAQVAALKNELTAIVDQNEKRGTADASHYKERAKLQAEVAALKRKVELFEKEKADMEATLEDVTLDKEQLQEEKDALEDRVEELRLDAETAQMEVEELKMELEDARNANASSTNVEGEDAEEVAQALSVQNARLREALIRLREQTTIEKMELSKQVREAERDAEAGRALSSEVESLRSLKMQLEEQISDLKDMVEQGAAFEAMVEDLSDRVLALEDDNIALRTTIRELEEASELTAEMEEVQADEIKALSRDLEGRDTIIRNMEEAIKMQRRREEDFVRTVANYRTTVATLKQEKKALLELQQGGEGEKSDLIAASQNALARAAQLVADAAETRRREAKAVTDWIELQVFKHLSLRVESLLPQNIAASEVSAIKGELMASKIVSKVSKILEGIAASFGETIRPALPASIDGEEFPDATTLTLSDEAKQKVVTMAYQSEFANVLIALSSDLIRFLAAGQWPRLLSSEGSVELGSLLGHSSMALDSVVETALQTIKQEGILTPEQSNIGALETTVKATMQALRSDIEREEGTLVNASWNPPALLLLKDASSAKFSIQGAAASLSAALNQDGDAQAPSALVSLYNRVELASSQSGTLTLRLASLDIGNEEATKALSSLVIEWKDAGEALLAAVRTSFSSDGDFSVCGEHAERVLKVSTQLASVLRSFNLNPSADERHHTLSPEVEDPWARIAVLARSVNAVDGDEEDVHYLRRARDIQSRLAEAVDNEPKLAEALSNISNLEKSLSSKTKEISMQSARLSELEKLLAKSNTSTSARGKAAVDFRSSEEFKSLMEENRVLLEAMDVLQRQVDEYENEIRVLKDFKSPTKGASSKRTPRRALTSVSDMSPYGRGGGTGADESNAGVLEATIFRPALQRALKDASKWKASSIGAALASLPPLPTPLNSSGGTNSSVDALQDLTTALASWRREKASASLVDLSRRDKSAKAQFREMLGREASASRRVKEVVLQYQRTS